MDLSPDTVPVVDSPDTTVIQNCHCGKCPVMKDRSEQVCCKIEKSWQEKYNSSGENLNRIMPQKYYNYVCLHAIYMFICTCIYIHIYLYKHIYVYIYIIYMIYYNVTKSSSLVFIK